MAKDKTPRVRKTPAERATERLRTEQRKVAGIQGRITKARTALREVEAELAPAEAALDYALANPALPTDVREQAKPEPEPTEPADG